MKLILVLGALAAGVAACGDDAGDPRGSGTGADLGGTTWELVALGGDDVAVAGASWITFTDAGDVNGVGGCNDFTGRYELDGATIAIGPVASTRKLCVEPGLADQEQAFFAALEAATTATVGDGALRLADGADELAALAPLERADGVVGRWTAVSYDNGAEAVVGLVAGTEITVELADDGTVSGSAGCNTYSGSYTVDGESIAIGPLVQTERACVEPDGVMDQELLFLQALQSANTWSARGVALELRTADGALAVSLTPTTS